MRTISITVIALLFSGCSLLMSDNKRLGDEPEDGGGTNSNTDAAGDSDSDNDTDTDTDSDTDSDTDADTDLLPMTDCEGGKYDPDTLLCWQDPPSAYQMNWFSAVSYCEELTAGVWSLPTADELISLLRGCQNGIEADMGPSLCTMNPDNCSLADTCGSVSNCDVCSDGCYWNPALNGSCSVYWSSSSYAPDPDLAWYVYFSYGDVVNLDKEDSGYVRCIRRSQ